MGPDNDSYSPAFLPPEVLMAFFAATCPSCKGALQLPDDRDVVKCMYCASSIVIREAQQAAGIPVGNLMKLASDANAAGNAAQAYDYYSRALEQAPSNHEAWLGKGEAAGMLSNLRGLRLAETIVCFRRAVETAPAEKQSEVKKEAARRMNIVATACFGLSLRHTQEFITVDSTWGEHLERCAEIMVALDAALLLGPNDKTTLENIVEVCRGNLAGIGGHEVSPEYRQKLEERFGRANYALKKLDPTYEAPNKPKGTPAWVNVAIAAVVIIVMTLIALAKVLG